jgi:hypothetical protein
MMPLNRVRIPEKRIKTLLVDALRSGALDRGRIQAKLLAELEPKASATFASAPQRHATVEPTLADKVGEVPVARSIDQTPRGGAAASMESGGQERFWHQVVHTIRDIWQRFKGPSGRS